MSYKTARNLGPGIMLLIFIMVSVLSFIVTSNISKKLRNIVEVEEVKLNKLYQLTDLIYKSAIEFYDFREENTDDIKPALQSLNSVIKGVKEISKLNTKEDELNRINHLLNELLVFKQALIGYSAEVEEGDRSNSSAQDIGTAAQDAINNVMEANQAFLYRTVNFINSNNKGILRTTSTYQIVLGTVLIVTVFFVFLSTFFLSRALSQPVKELVNKTRHVAEGDFTQKIEVNSDDEFGKLSNAYNEMIERLSEQRERLVDKDYVDSIITNMMDALIVTTPDKKIRTLNRAACDLLGYKEDELINRNISCLFPKEQRTFSKATVFEQLIKDGRVSNYETSFQSKYGRIVQVLFSGVVVRDKARNISYIVSTAKDITSIKDSEKSLLKQSQELIQSNTELQRIVYVASHDLQEPLRMVTSYVQLLAKRYKDRLDSDAREFISYAEDGTLTMRLLLKGLLAYSRIGTHGRPFELTDCKAVLEQVLINLQVSIEETKAVITHDPLPEVMADNVQLLQVLHNLISNAVRFHGKEPPRVHVSARNDGDNWVFSVKDNGIGIEDKFKEKIFQIFQRLGSGHGSSEFIIGLALCRRIVERHNGRIWIDSEPGKGSTIYFTIPIRKRSREPR